MSTIYFVQNLVNAKNYVGQTKYGTFRKRYGPPEKPHVDLRPGKGRRPLDNAFLKYGGKAFNFVDVMRNVPTGEIDFWERWWIKSLGTCDRNIGYNLESGGNKKKIRHPDSLAKVRARFKGIIPYKAIAASAALRRGKPGHKWTPEQLARKTPDLHPDYNRRHWIHPVHGEYFGGVNEMVRRFPDQKMKAGNLSKVARGLYGRKSEKGWRPYSPQQQQNLL